jgi:hypothetical protein
MVCYQLIVLVGCDNERVQFYTFNQVTTITECYSDSARVGHHMLSTPTCCLIVCPL